MSLTLDAEQKMESVGLVGFFGQSKATWQALAQQAYNFVKHSFPQTAIIRRDDVAKALLPVIEVNEDLINYLHAKKCTQKYWFKFFGDLILDKCWVDISKAKK